MCGSAASVIEHELKRLVGASGSGKSTLKKQFRIVNSGGVSLSERKQWRTVIFSNLTGSFNHIIGLMQQTEIDLEHPDNMVSRQLF
jgi:ABC-type oligopeptide transport system ATPase subunit